MGTAKNLQLDHQYGIGAKAINYEDLILIGAEMTPENQWREKFRMGKLFNDDLRLWLRTACNNVDTTVYRWNSYGQSVSVDDFGNIMNRWTLTLNVLSV